MALIKEYTKWLINSVNLRAKIAAGEIEPQMSEHEVRDFLEGELKLANKNSQEEISQQELYDFFFLVLRDMREAENLEVTSYILPIYKVLGL